MPAIQTSEMAMITAAERKRFRSEAHAKKPIVATGLSGLTNNVIRAVDEALEFHELIKIKLHPVLRADRKVQAEQICLATGATLIQLIGKIAIIYRKKPEKNASGSSNR